MGDPIYDKHRAERLVDLLRALAARIRELESDAALLAAGPELLKMMGDARSELFHYEVRSTYDTPEIADSRRVVEQARRQLEALDFGDQPLDFDESEGEEPWRSSGI
jgi:hypothetical protein